MISAPRPRALVFDVMGTVVDDVGTERSVTTSVVGRRGASEQAGLDLAAAVARRLGGLMEAVNTGARPWASHRDLRREAVRSAAAEAGILGLTEADETELVGVVEQFAPWPDSVTGLEQLQRQRVVVALTNADPDELASMSFRAGLAWHLALSTRPSQSFKPDPRAYDVALDALGLSPEDVMMVAAHVWDLRAAAAVGMRTCFVRRPGQELPADEEFDVIVDDLADLAETLGAP